MVPVLDKDKNPLMPCSEKRARKLMEKGRAKPYWYKGVFSIILQDTPKSTYKQEVCIGVDPGSKFNGYSVKSEASTLLNLQVNAVISVKKKMKERAMLRHSRRQRKTPYRKCRFNRSKKNWIPPSTKARWQQHLNIIKWVNKLYPLSHVAVEDVKAKSIKGARKYNINFSPIEIGKNWFYNEIEKDFELYTYQGYDTFNLRNTLGLKKNSKKDKKDFYTHAVDAWCIANQTVGGHIEPDNTQTLYLKPLMHHRRRLHDTVPKRGNKRKNYGGTMSMSIKRGALVRHPKWGITYVGGTNGKKISLHDFNNGRRICQNAKIEDLNILTVIKHIIH